MDPASVLAFVLVGLKSAKLAHKVLTSFKDAPDNVKSATVDVEGLLLTLESLSKCRALGERGGGDALRAPIDACLRDIESFAKELQRLTPGAPNSRREKYKKRFAAMWEEKALTQMSAKIASHAVNLSLCLNVLQSDVVVGIPSQLDSISREATAQQTAAFTTQTATLEAVGEGITRLGGGFENMGEAMRTMASASTTSQGMLEEILQHVVRLTMNNRASSGTIEVQGASVTATSPYPVDTGREPCKELLNIITRLRSRVNDNRLRGRVMSGEAKDIINDLLLALELMKSDDFLQAGVVSSLVVDPDTCSTCRGSHTADLQTSLTTAYEALLPNRQLMVNHTNRRVLQRTSGSYRQRLSTVSGYTYETNIGTLSVLSQRTLRRAQQPLQLGRSEPESPDPMDDEEELTTSVSLISKRLGSQARHAISVNIRQTHNYDGIFSAIPHFMVYNVLPAGSPVFSVVRAGRVRDFQALLREGKASLRDQDEYGAPLLFYANQQPEMCRYLIESGANVDHVASFKGVTGDDTIQCALGVDVNDDDAEEDQLESILLCRKYLLQAGCDPTLPVITYGSEPDCDHFQYFLVSAVPKAIEIMFDFGSSFVNANTKTTPTALSPLSELCHWGFWGAESIAVLLKRNADVTERDGNGRTCLHYCLSSPWNNGWSTFGKFDYINRYSAGIILLIQHGADVYAEDQDGRSVSDIAYSRQHRHHFDNVELGCVWGDAWDFALAVCGHDISTFRQGRCRKASYGERYNRQHFEKLWEGHEHLCPYYYDEEDCLSEEDFKAFSEEGSAEGWVTTDAEDEESDVVDLEEDSD